MGDLDGAVYAYEQALRHNQYSIQAMNGISCILRTKENFPRAVEYLQGILKLDPNNGEVWGSLGKIFQSQFESLSELTHSQGHCFLMMEDLQQAYSAYQQALYHLRDPKVGILELIRSTKLIGAPPGAETLVWHRYPIRSVWIARARRRSLFASHANAAGF